MSDLFLKLRKFWLDTVFIGVPAAGALACWIYALPLWMLVICVVALVLALISLLGDLGLFGGRSDT